MRPYRAITTVERPALWAFVQINPEPPVHFRGLELTSTRSKAWTFSVLSLF